MTTIQEIMESVYSSQFAASAYEASSGPGTKELEVAMFAADGEVQALITQAIAEARADGAREMREFAAQESRWGGDSGCDADAMTAHIRALPLPAKHEPARLTDTEIAEAFLSRCPAHLRGAHDVRDMQARPDVIELGRAIETAVLAANGLTT